MTYLPDGGVLITLLIVPLAAGITCGLTGSGSAIIVQVMFRLFQSLLGLSVAETDAEASRRILAIAAVLSLSQYPVAVWGLWKSKERYIRWEAVAYLAPGINIVVWIGTFIAMHYSPETLLVILGITLIVIAVYQFIYQSVVGRKVDDEKVKLNMRKKLDLKYNNQHVINNDDVRLSSSSNNSQPPSQNNLELTDVTTNTTNPLQSSTASHVNATSTTGASTTVSTTNHNNYNGGNGTDLADLYTLGDTAPTLPRKLKPPNPSFDLHAYSRQNGLDLRFEQNGIPYGDSSGEHVNSKVKKSKKLTHSHYKSTPHYDGNNRDHISAPAHKDPALNVKQSSQYHSSIVKHQDDEERDEDEYAMIMGYDYGDDDDDHKINHRNNDQSCFMSVYHHAKNNPKTMVIGLITGCIAGLLGGMMGINGPPVILFLFYLKLNGNELRDTSMLVFFTNLPCLLFARIYFNVFHLDEWLIYIIAVIMSTVGLYTGTYFHTYCDTRLVMTFLQFVILLSSMTLTKPSIQNLTSGIFLAIYLIIAMAILAFIGWRIARNNAIKDKVKQQFAVLHGANNNYSESVSLKNRLKRLFNTDDDDLNNNNNNNNNNDGNNNDTLDSLGTDHYPNQADQTTIMTDTNKNDSK